MKRLLLIFAASSLSFVVAPAVLSQTDGGQNAATANPAETQAAAPPSDTVIARVGDQAITWGQVNTMLNSSAVVGVSVPAVGTSERDKALIILLDKFISANLVYLDALEQGLDKDPIYRRDLALFEDAMLADLYRRKVVIGDIPVSQQEIDDYLQKNKTQSTASPENIRLGVEVKLRRSKMRQRLSEAGQHMRDGVEVVIHEDELAAAGDAKRPDSAVVAEIDGSPVTWGEVKEKVIAAGKVPVRADPLAMEDDDRRAALQQQIDLRIVAQKARAAGLDQDRMYKVRVNEYRKTRLINLHRERLIADMEPDKAELKTYYEANKARFVQPATRKVQMVVVKTKEEAEDLKKKIQAGELTMYQAAQEHSIAPTAKQDLGEIGWVSKGQSVPALDAAIFALGPGEVGGPVETAAGWHLFTVQDEQEAKYENFDDPATQNVVRRQLLDGKLDAYEVNLRKSKFPVEVYQDVLVRLSQQEADAVAKLAEKAKEPGSVTQQRLKELGSQMKP